MVSLLTTLSKVYTSHYFPDICSSRLVSRPLHSPPILRGGIVGYFDEATKDGYCGVGMIIILENSLSCKLCMDAG